MLYSSNNKYADNLIMIFRNDVSDIVEEEQEPEAAEYCSIVVQQNGVYRSLVQLQQNVSHMTPLNSFGESNKQLCG